MRNKEGKGKDRVDQELGNEKWVLLRTLGIPVRYAQNLNLSLSSLAAIAKKKKITSIIFFIRKKGLHHFLGG